MGLAMFDSVDLSQIPKDAKAVAGYVGGRWPTFSKLAAEFPNAKRVSIAVTAEEDADALDIERGDALISQAPAWVRRQSAHGAKRPIVYCSLSDAATVLKVLKASGIGRSQVRLWTAHYTFKPHVCNRNCGLGFFASADATQFTDRALAKNLDESLLSDTFFVHKKVNRAALRAWILAQRAHGATWAALKKTAKWRLWRKAGGK